MRTFWNKKTIIALLSGMMFLCGGVFTASAAPGDTAAAQQPVQQTRWAFKYKLTPSYLARMGAVFSGGSAPEVADQVQNYWTQAQCEAGQASYASGGDYVITTPCYQLTLSELATANATALQNARNAGFEQDPNLKRFGINCTLNPLSKDGGPLHCIPATVYYLVYKPAGFLLTASAYMFDAVFPISLSKNYIDQQFVRDGWTVLRDFANMAFIFILLYIGISTMLMGESWQRPVINVIIIAIFINFSLFFTKIIIDAGNILAVGVYEQIGEPSAAPHSRGTEVTEHELSLSLAKYFEPQKIMGATVKGDAFDAIFIFLISAGISVFVAYVFFKASFLMIGRLIMLWYFMISSPIAFLSWATPKQSGFFNKWLGDLIEQTFMPVIFLFFLYIIMMILNAPMMTDIVTEGTPDGIVGFVLVAVLKAAVVVIALGKALEKAESMSGEIGKAAQKFGGMALGTLGVGGVGVAGRGAVRMLAAAGGALEGRGGTLGKLGKAAASTAHGLRDQTFDLRNAPIPGVVGGGSVGSRLGLGEGSKQTFASVRAEKVKEAKEEVKRSKEKTQSIAQAQAKAKEDEERKARKEEYLKKKEKETIADFKKQLGWTEDHPNYNKDLDSEEVKEAKKAALGRLEEADARAQAAYDASDKNKIDERTEAIVNKNKAKKELDKFKSAEAEVEKINKQLTELKGDKGGGKKEEKNEVKH